MAWIKWTGQVEVRTAPEYAAIHLRSDSKPARKRPKKSSPLGIPLWSLLLQARRWTGDSTKSSNLDKPGNGRVGWEEGTWCPSINKTLFLQSCLVQKQMRKGHCECQTWRHRWIKGKQERVPGPSHSMQKRETCSYFLFAQSEKSKPALLFWKLWEKVKSKIYLSEPRKKKTIWISFFLDVQNN